MNFTEYFSMELTLMKFNFSPRNKANICGTCSHYAVAAERVPFAICPT